MFFFLLLDFCNLQSHGISKASVDLLHQEKCLHHLGVVILALAPSPILNSVYIFLLKVLIVYIPPDLLHRCSAPESLSS